MFDGTTKMFEGFRAKIIISRKKEYENRFNDFLESNRECLEEMFDYVKGREDKEVAAKEVANNIAENLVSEYGKKGKIPKLIRPDLTLYFIYFVFPAILKLNKADSVLLADAIRDEWRERTDNPDLSYATYDDLYPGFKEKIFGFF